MLQHAAPIVVVQVVVAIGVATYVARQCRKPSIYVGRLLARSMNASHAALTRWGLSGVEIKRDVIALDIGCGGGRTIETIASFATDGHVFGIDYSAGSVAVARQTNHASIAAGRVRIEQASVAALPFADQTFDLITAVETHYYWPELPASVREVMRVLKPGGTFVIIAETYRGRSIDWLYLPVMRFMLRGAYLTVEEHRRLLVDAGYRDVQVRVEPARGWIGVVGRR